MLVVLPPIFVVDTKIIYGYNFVAPLSLMFVLMNKWTITRHLSKLKGIFKQIYIKIQ